MEKMTTAKKMEDRRLMLRDIEREITHTRHETGREAFDQRVMAAMAQVPREQFIPQPYSHCAYANSPLPIGHGQTISQPYMVALMANLLDPQPESILLEIGTGCGYQAAVLARIVRHVYSIEIIEALATAAGQRLRRLGYDNITVRQGDGYLGWPEQAPFDGIVVTAAAPCVPPPLLEQLKAGGKLVIPIGYPGSAQMLTLVEKDADGAISRQDLLLVAFVPLTRAASWWSAS